MRNLLSSCFFCAFIVGPAACHDDNPADSHEKAPPIATLSGVQQIPLPPDLAKPSADAIRMASGVAYKKLVSNGAGAQPRAEDIALVRYTAWRASGETFFTSKARGQPIAVKLSHTSSAFSEVLPLVRKGEKVMVWAPPTRGLPEGVVYEIDVDDIVRPALANPATPDRNSDRNKVRNGSATQSGTAVRNSSAISSTQSH